MSDSLPMVPADAPRPSVSLVLGSGGARGLAHIGVLEVLDARGYRVESVVGASMGALVGGIYAAGKLQPYRDWARALQKFDVLKLLDWTWSGGGFIKGERVIGALREMVGDVCIEDLPIAFTAVATDLDRQSEVWLSRGRLFDAIRASIAIPGLFTPHLVSGRRLVDGGLLNPLPIAATLRDLTDITIVVNVNGPDDHEALPAPLPEPSNGYAQKFTQYFENVFGKRERAPVPTPAPGWRDLVSRSFETMQYAITRLKMATHDPDVTIDIPRNSIAFYEYHRTEEMIALGRQQAERALDRYERERQPERQS
jgi:NTE family protein